MADRVAWKDRDVKLGMEERMAEVRRTRDSMVWMGGAKKESDWRREDRSCAIYAGGAKIAAWCKSW